MNVDADGHETKIVENIIKQVVQEVNHTPLDVGDTHVKDIELLLRNDFDMVGIGGIGKTNLASRYLRPNIMILDQNRKLIML